MVGKAGEKQIISANIDVAFIIQSIDNNFNINRLERYMAVCYSSGIEPVLVISKVDLSTETELKTAMDSLEKRNKKIKTILLSNITDQGLDQILNFIEKGKTYCVVGSSGVGKSTLINKLLGDNVLRTGQISQSTNKGRHITEHRELFILDNGGIIIDTPGMKELGVTEDTEGLQTAFQEIYDMTLKCRFSDCTHVNESGCAVIQALNDGIIDKDSLENFRRLLKEQERFTLTIAEKRKKDREFGKMARNVLKEKKKTKG
jgi:ribosome biogenesis GTPase